MSAIILLGTFIFIGLLSLLSKHRAGTATIALAASSIVANLWAQPLVLLMTPHFPYFKSDFLLATTTIVLTLLPAFFLLFSGHKYQNWWQRLVGVIIFGGAAFLLLAQAFGGIIVLDETSTAILKSIEVHKSLALTIVLAAAFLDILMGHATKSSNHGGEKHKK